MTAARRGIGEWQNRPKKECLLLIVPIGWIIHIWRGTSMHRRRRSPKWNGLLLVPHITVVANSPLPGDPKPEFTPHPPLAQEPATDQHRPKAYATESFIPD